MKTPMEILLGSRRDKATLDAMTSGLRNRKDIAQLALLSGDPTVGGFGKTLYGDVDTTVGRRLAEREKKAQRDLTQGYYSQLGQQAQQAAEHRKNVLAETIRHNKAMEAKAGLSSQRYSDSQIRNLSRDLTKKNVPEVASAIDAVNRELKKYEGRNLPGIGQIQSALPGFMLPENAREVRTVVARIRNIILKARSGGAVTPEEADRLLEEFAFKTGFTDQDFIKAWKDFQGQFNQGVNNIFAGYDPETIELYQYRMGNAETSAPVETESTSWGDIQSTGSPQQEQGISNWSDLQR